MKLQLEKGGEELVIHPTGKCFDDALDFITERLKEDTSLAWDARLILVHGICLLPEGLEADQPFAHAWVEEGELVWQSGVCHLGPLVYSCTKASFEEALRPQDVTRYTIRQVWQENTRSGNYGPWVPRYEALCKDKHLRAGTS